MGGQPGQRPGRGFLGGGLGGGGRGQARAQGPAQRRQPRLDGLGAVGVDPPHEVVVVVVGQGVVQGQLAFSDPAQPDDGLGDHSGPGRQGLLQGGQLVVAADEHRRRSARQPYQSGRRHFGHRRQRRRRSRVDRPGDQAVEGGGGEVDMVGAVESAVGVALQRAVRGGAHPLPVTGPWKVPREKSTWSPP